MFRVDGKDVAVFRCRSGNVFATSAECPHRGGPLADGLVGGDTVICPMHGFAVRPPDWRGGGPRVRPAGHAPCQHHVGWRPDAGTGVSGKAPPPSFGGARVLLLESRLAAETAAMVRKLGGEPDQRTGRSRSADRRRRAPSSSSSSACNSRATSWSTFLTGAAVTRVFAIAERLELATLLQAGLRRATHRRARAKTGRRARQARADARDHRCLAVHDGGRAGGARCAARSPAARRLSSTTASATSPSCQRSAPAARGPRAHRLRVAGAARCRAARRGDRLDHQR